MHPSKKCDIFSTLFVVLEILTVDNFSQFLKKFCIYLDFSKLKLEISILFKDLHESNIFEKSITLDVWKFFIFKSFKNNAFENICDIFVTLLVSKLDKSKDMKLVLANK